MNYEKWFSNLLSSNDFITTDRYFDSQSRLGYRYTKRDYLFTFGRWRGKFQTPAYLRQIKKFKDTLVIGHSDLPVLSSDLRTIKLFGYRKIYGINLLNTDGVSESIPLGICSDCDDSKIHRLLGSIKHFETANNLSERVEVFDNSIYVNFTVSNNVRERQYLFNLLKGMPNAYFESTVFTDFGRVNYLKSLRKYAMVACPEGNGFDTHRIWETLYMGGTPIIKACDYLPRVLNQLPVIILSNWREINNSSTLEELWYSAQSKRLNFKYLTASYWLEHMASKKIG
jgi:hypothetical protein